MPVRLKRHSDDGAALANQDLGQQRMRLLPAPFQALAKRILGQQRMGSQPASLQAVECAARSSRRATCTRWSWWRAAATSSWTGGRARATPSTACMCWTATCCPSTRRRCAAPGCALLPVLARAFRYFSQLTLSPGRWCAASMSSRGGRWAGAGLASQLSGSVPWGTQFKLLGNALGHAAGMQDSGRCQPLQSSACDRTWAGAHGCGRARRCTTSSMTASGTPSRRSTSATRRTRCCAAAASPSQAAQSSVAGAPVSVHPLFVAVQLAPA